MQRIAIPRIIAGDNALAMAPTGHGKTEAAMLPIPSQMVSMDRGAMDKGIYVLYITPLKALINDLTVRIEWWASRLGFTVGRKLVMCPRSRGLGGIERFQRY